MTRRIELHGHRGARGLCWGPHHENLTRAAIAEAHDRGPRVIPWTVNIPADMRRLIGWGVDGLITDRPDLFRDLMDGSARDRAAESAPRALPACSPAG